MQTEEEKKGERIAKFDERHGTRDRMCGAICLAL
jgi:hypothetical protein